MTPEAGNMALGASAAVLAIGSKQIVKERLKLHEAFSRLLWWVARVATSTAYAYDEAIRAYRRQREALK